MSLISKDDCYYLGKIFKAVGLDGNLSIYLDTTHPQEYKKLESVFVDIHGVLTPFFISKIAFIGKNKANISFDDFNSLQAVEQLVGLDLYLPLAALPKLKGKAFYYHEVAGFTVIDKNFGEIGVVEEIMDLPNNPLIQIKHKGIEILIPKRDEIILKVDREHKILEVICPEGLLDLYLNP